MCCRSSWRPKQKFSGKPWVHKPRYLNQLLDRKYQSIPAATAFTKVTCADQALLAAKGVEVRTELFSACG
jgi:hypothetical protein